MGCSYHGNNSLPQMGNGRRWYSLFLCMMVTSSPTNTALIMLTCVGQKKTSPKWNRIFFLLKANIVYFAFEWDHEHYDIISYIIANRLLSPNIDLDSETKVFLVFTCIYLSFCRVLGRGFFNKWLEFRVGLLLFLSLVHRHNRKTQGISSTSTTTRSLNQFHGWIYYLWEGGLLSCDAVFKTF